MTTRPHQLDLLVLGDAPGAWRSAGFAVEGAADGGGESVLGRTRVRLTGAGGGVLGWRLRGVDADVDGIAAHGTLDPVTGPAAAHPNGISTIDHVVLATDDADRTVGALVSVGLELRRRRELGGGATQSFLWAGDVILEVVAPPPPGGATPEHAGRASVWGLSLVAPDLDATAAALGALLGTPRDAVQPGRRIATLRGDAGISVPLAVMTPHPRNA